MKKFILSLLFLPSFAFAESFSMTWDPVTQDVSGNTITVTGYNVYWSTVSGQKGTKIGSPTVTNFKYIETKPGTYYATVTALQGTLESAPSNEASGVVTPKPPVAPKTFKIVIEGTATVTPVN